MFVFISTGEDWPVAIQICSFSRKDCTVWYIMLWRSFYIFLLNSTFWFCSYLLKKKLHLYSSNLIRRNTWYAIWIDLNNYTISLSNIYIELGEIPLKCVNSTSERLKYSTLGTINCKKTFTSIQEHRIKRSQKSTILMQIRKYERQFLRPLVLQMERCLIVCFPFALGWHCFTKSQKPKREMWFSHSLDPKDSKKPKFDHLEGRLVVLARAWSLWSELH